MNRTHNGSDRAANPFLETFMDHAKTVFLLSLAATIALYAYLLYGLFSGHLMNVPNMPAAEQARVLANVQKFSLALNISLAVLIITSILIYYNETSLGYTFLILAALLSYGLQLSIDMFFGSGGSGARFADGRASQMTLRAIYNTGLMLGAPGIILVLRHMILHVREGRYAGDLTIPQYGKDVTRQEKEYKSLIPVLAHCWQMPFCRAGIRKECPIFHARTKCWKQRVGCMCEENIIRLAQATEDKAKLAAMGAATGAIPGGGSTGFVPIGDLMTDSLAADREKIPTRPGPRGVRIPHNPHLTDAQKVARCQNCIIYNEHQRYKYQMLAPIVTLIVPLLVYLNFDAVRMLLTDGMNGLDRLIANISYTGKSGLGSVIQGQISGSLPVETIIIVCLTLIVMTWALRFLEYCVFKLKI